MAIAIITLTDSPDGRVAVKLEFGPNGTDENSGAHHMAIDALEGIRGKAIPETASADMRFDHEEGG